MSVIQIMGLASNSSSEIHYRDLDLDKNLLRFLREKGITIASSCDGEGVCKKCSIQNDWLTCKLTLKTFLERQNDGKIFVSYL
jgi:Na+-transporting NADH:ubiquinone oxidoreductase subunit NqrF